MRLGRRRVDEPVGEEPDYRFTLANERTFLAWLRTALALDAAGLAVVELFPEFTFAGGRRTIGVALLALGTWVAATAYGRWARVQRALRTNSPIPPSSAPRVLGVGLAAVGLLAAVLLVLRSGR